MKLGVTIPVEEGLTLPQLTALARAAEESGYDTVLAGEVAGPDVFGLLAAVCSSQSRARVGTGIVPMTTRSLPLLAMGFTSLSSLAPGRVLAGVGIGSRTVVEDWHGRSLPPAVAFTREFIPTFRRALAGERIDVEGEHLRVRGFRLGLTPPEPVPVMLAAMNPRMLRLAGALADAVQLTWCPPDEVPAQLKAVYAGAREAGRDPDEIEVVASFFGYGGPRTDEARERYRRYVLAYSQQPTHRAAFTRSLPRLYEIDALWAAGDRAAALALVDDAALERLVAVGAEAVAERARLLHEAGVDVPVLLPAGAAPGDYEGALTTVLGLGERASG
jgi:probable F420-dependent oxidoreductase